ncbi:short-chain dehydrogenase [bacterium]|nr:short-chain dehydrogenase [bacterium]|tara:strand:- start:1628 stop:2473 length:846 start_codon:yes stop_codon:yes gene_type:complete
MEIEGKVVIVTGAGAGIGAALADVAASKNARVVVVADKNGENAAKVAGGINAIPYEVDVSSENQIQKMVAKIENNHGPIDLFCSNAGFVTSAGLEDTNERIQKMWEVHVMSHIYAARAVLPQMIANGGGYLLNTASAAGLLTQIGSLSYSITKSAAVSLAEWISITHFHQGIRVSVLCPQAVRTDILSNSPDNEDGDDPEWEEGGVASSDGIVEPNDVAEICMEAISEERFMVLPHTQVQGYAEFKAQNIEKWLSGMRKFQDRLFLDEPLPGDLMQDFRGA